MLGNSSSEKTLLISPTTNNHILDDHKDAMMASSAPTEGLKAMDLKSLEQQQQLQPQPQQQPLRCPRCDSSNTKFCYYNNYSLSQPRHFCKACKRYWTRGGTLRNVPVGGGCRKNKRVRRPSSSPSSCLDPPANPSSHINALGISSSRHSPLLFGLPGRGGAASDVNPAFPCFINSHALSGYELHPQLNALGLGFTAPGGQIGDLSKYGLFGSSSSSGFTADISPMIAVAGEVLGGGSGHQQQRMSSVDNNNGLKQNFPSFEEWQVSGAECGAATNICQMEQAAGSGRPEPSVYWNGNAASVGGWSDLGNMGSSVTSLI